MSNLELKLEQFPFQWHSPQKKVLRNKFNKGSAT